jgi:transporter family protein
MIWQIFALGSAFFAGLTAVLGKAGVEGINSNLATLVRTVVILAVTLIFVSIRREWQPWEEFSRRSILFLVLSGVATAASWLCYYRALQLGPASQVGPFEKISVVFTVLLSVVILHEALSLKTALGTLMVAAGAILIAW